MLIAFAFILFADSDQYARGLELFRAGKLDEAARSFAAVTETRPGFAPAWKALGVVYVAQARYALAAEPLERACTLQPDLPDACYYHGRNLYELNRYQDSLAALERALKTDRFPARIQVARARALEALGRRAAAEAAFQSAIALPRAGASADDDPRIGYGVFLMRDGRAADALAAIEPAARDYPNSARAHLELGRALFDLGRTAEAAASLERAVKLDAQSGPAALLLGRVLMHLGRRTEALPYLERGRALSSQPDH